MFFSSIKRADAPIAKLRYGSLRIWNSLKTTSVVFLVNKTLKYNNRIIMADVFGSWYSVNIDKTLKGRSQTSAACFRGYWESFYLKIKYSKIKVMSCCESWMNAFILLSWKIWKGNWSFWHLLCLCINWKASR
jgi:hypothetical protein